MAGPLWSCPAVIVLIVLAVALHLGHPLISNLRCSSSGRFRLGRRPFYHHRVMYSTTEDVISERPIVNNGTPHTEASRAKISAANKGKKPWNVGKQHSEETKRRIAEKTKEAMDKRKLDQAMALGFTVEEFDAKKIEDRKEKKRIKDATKVKGLTDDGRRRLSEGLKKRWENPEFRKAYLESTKGNRNHSDETRARISLAIKQKWMDEEYRAKINRYTPSADVRERISQTLKARWESPEFRDMMMNRSTVRTDAWRAQLSEKIRLKWEDPEYRGAVMHGIQNANRKNRTVTYRLRPESAGAAAKRMALEVRKKQRAAAAAEKERDRHRREMLRAAKTLAKRQQLELGVLVDGKSIKELLGKELWFEEKMRRRKSVSEAFLDDATLEQQLQQEWAEEEDDGVLMDDDEFEDDVLLGADTDTDRRRGVDVDDEGEGEGEDDDDDGWDDNIDMGDEGLDVIEVYDEDGELVGTYTAIEFDKLKRSQANK